MSAHSRVGFGRRIATVTVAFAVGLAVLATGVKPAAAVDSYHNGNAQIQPTSNQAITQSQYNGHSGYNYYIRVDNGISTNVYLRWVKCGHSSTQDTASSVGGNAKLTNSTPFQGAVGTNFLNGTCAKIWARKLSTTTYKPTLYFESYFNNVYIF